MYPCDQAIGYFNAGDIMGMHIFGGSVPHDYLTASPYPQPGSSGIAEILIPVSTFRILQTNRLPFLED